MTNIVWIRTYDIREIPIGSLISDIENEEYIEPSFFWFRKDDHVLKGTFTKLECIDLNQEGEAIAFEFTTEKVQRLNRKYYASVPGFRSDFPKGFLYAIEVKPYDPNQEPEDDCL